MKFKIKLDNDKKIIQADNLEDLHNRVTSEFGLIETAILSLNGRDPIQSIGALSDAGLVGGDILRVITTEQPSPNVINENAPTPPSPSQPPSHSAPLTFEELVSKLRLTKVTENIYSYESDGTIMITSNKIESMEIFNIVAKLDDEIQIENVIVPNPNQIVELLEPALKKQINQLRNWVGLRPTDGLLSLPDEILTKILSKLNPKSLLALGGVCQKLRNISDNENIWKGHYVKDFTTLDASELTWREMYIRALRERKRRERELRVSRSEPSFHHPYQIPGHAHPNPLGPGHIPGMIGGEYDLRPFGGFPTNPLAGPFRPRGDPITPGSLTDPDFGRRGPNAGPNPFPHGNDHHGMFNPDGSLNQFPNRPGRGNRDQNRFNPFGGGFM